MSRVTAIVSVRQSGRRFRGLWVYSILGPWISLGVHVDLGAPCIDLHLGWWQVSMGWQRVSTDQDRDLAELRLRAAMRAGLSQLQKKEKP